MSADATSPQHVCEGCGDAYPSIRAAMLCEDEDVAADRAARRARRTEVQVGMVNVEP